MFFPYSRLHIKVPLSLQSAILELPLTKLFRFMENPPADFDTDAV